MFGRHSIHARQLTVTYLKNTDAVILDVGRRDASPSESVLAWLAPLAGSSSS